MFDYRKIPFLSPPNRRIEFTKWSDCAASAPPAPYTSIMFIHGLLNAKIAWLICHQISTSDNDSHDVAAPSLPHPASISVLALNSLNSYNWLRKPHVSGVFHQPVAGVMYHPMATTVAIQLLYKGHSTLLSCSPPRDLASQILQIDGAQLGVFVQIEEPPRPMDGLSWRKVMAALAGKNLVVEPALWKIWVRQVGWWNSPYMEK